MVRFKPATALLGFIYADPFRLTAAQKVRREEALDADRTSEVIANLVLDAEFHRAMMKTSAAAQDVGMTRKLLQRMRRRRAKVMKQRDLRAGGRSVTGGTDKMVECVPEDDSMDDSSEETDTGILSLFASSAEETSPCQVGYICTPTDESTTGGHCVPASTHHNGRTCL